MLRRVFLAVVGTACTFPFAGCGNSAGLFPVSGKVLYKGEAASGAVVYFQRQGDPDPLHKPVPFGIVGDDGSFSLQSDGLGSGASPGTYTVLIEWRDAKGNGVVPVKSKGQAKLVKRSRVRSGPDRLKGRYLDISKPLLQAEVKPGSNQLTPFELSD
jgi:hypothetical protein